jgi:acyl transferase domain-containing protein
LLGKFPAKFYKLEAKDMFVSTEELQKGEDKSLVNDPTLAQPLCTAIQIALVDLLSLFGIEPTTVIGHSSGEIAAAYVAHSPVNTV